MSFSFVFELPDNKAPGMRVASAVVVKGAGEGVKDKEGKPVIRPYTPTTSPDTTGHLDLLIKKYPNGAMTSHIHGLKPGDKLAIKGPIDKFEVRITRNAGHVNAKMVNSNFYKSPQTSPSPVQCQHL
jgi:cytochrome-b5 reductase